MHEHSYPHTTDALVSWPSQRSLVNRMPQEYYQKGPAHLEAQTLTVACLMKATATETTQNRHWSRHAFRDIPKAQYAFKSLSVHGILQFTMLIALRCALHRCSNRDIHRWKLWAAHGDCHKQKAASNDLRCAVAVGTNRYVHHPVQPTTREHLHGEPECTSPHRLHRRIHKSVIGTCANDPSAGSPTETLLRLLLPLSDKVH